jgi:hypothetical protein
MGTLMWKWGATKSRAALIYKGIKALELNAWWYWSMQIVVCNTEVMQKCRLLSDAGILPNNWFSKRSNSSKFVGSDSWSGMFPKKLLWLRSRAWGNLKRPISTGMLQLRLLLPTNIEGYTFERKLYWLVRLEERNIGKSKWVLVTGAFGDTNAGNEQSSFGNSPEMRLSDKSKMKSLWRVDNQVGIEPVIRFVARARYSSFLSFDSHVGN